MADHQKHLIALIEEKAIVFVNEHYAQPTAADLLVTKQALVTGMELALLYYKDVRDDTTHGVIEVDLG